MLDAKSNGNLARTSLQWYQGTSFEALVLGKIDFEQVLHA
jgi:hypothetical protein